MRNKFVVLPLGIFLIALSPFTSWGEDVKGGDPKIIQTPEGAVKDKTTNPKTPVSNPLPEGAPPNKVPDPESQAAPAIKIQEGAQAEG